MIYAPIYIPTLCRYEHFKQCIESLAQCEGASETEVYVALDYPAKESHLEGYEKIKTYLETAGNMTFKKLHVHKRERNYGLGLYGNSATMREYITERYDRFILSEDDNVFAPNFLLYMNTCLERYRDDPDVVAVCGYSYPVEWDVSEGATVLKQQINVSTWGVGLWTEKYQKMRQDLSNGILKSSFTDVLENKTYKKMIDACFIEYILNACNVSSDKNSLCYGTSDVAMRQYLAVTNKYAITPIVSKVRNLGFDGTGAFCQKIEKSQFGDTARTYDYSKQKIDESRSFAFILDEKNNSVENHKLLNDFDSRSLEELKFPVFLLWASENIGIWSARLLLLVHKCLNKLKIFNH